MIEDRASSGDSQRWSDEAGRSLQAARVGFHRESQGACAAHLNELGAASIGQRTVSTWETGKTKRPEPANVDAVVRYLAEAAMTLEGPRHDEPDLVEPEPIPMTNGSDRQALRDLSRRSDGARGRSNLNISLDRTQRALISAAIQRVAAGTGPLGREDIHLISWLSDVLHVDPVLQFDPYDPYEAEAGISNETG